MSGAATALWVAVGGAVGAVVRWLLQSSLTVFVAGFPLGTFTANLVGSFLMGLVFPLHTRFPEAFRPAVMIGFLGAMTTMSSYAMEVVTLAGERRMGAALGHWAGGALLCIGACACGYWIAARFL